MLSLPEARDYAIASDLPPLGRLLLLMLASRTNGEPVCWPSIDRLCADTGMSRTSVFEWIGRLADAGYITVTPGGGRGKSNVYQLVTETVREADGLETVREPNGSPGAPEVEKTSSSSGEPSRERKDHVDLTVREPNGSPGGRFRGPVTKEQQAFPGGYVPEQVNRRRSRPPGGRQNKPKQPAPIPSDGQAAASTAAGKAFSGEERPRFQTAAEKREQRHQENQEFVLKHLAERRARREQRAKEQG